MSFEQYFNYLWYSIFSFYRIAAIFEFSFLGIVFKTKTRKSRKIFIFWIYKVQMNVGLFLITISTFWVLKLTQSKTGSIWLIQRVKGFLNPNTSYMISNVAGSFWVWCHLNSILRVFEVTFSYFSVLVFFMNIGDFRVLVFGYRPENENPEITDNLYFWVYIVSTHVDLFFDHYFNFLGAKSK